MEYTARFDPNENLYSTDQVAEMLQTSRQVINGEIRRGRLEAFRVGRINRIKQSALDAYTSRQTRTGGTHP